MPATFPPTDRRSVLAGLAVACAFPFGTARANETDAITGFTIDWQWEAPIPSVAASLAAQIALVRRLRIKPDIVAFFASQPITVDRIEGTRTRAGPRGVFFERRPVPADNPVLLHELLHRYHLLRLPGGRANPVVIGYFDAVRASGQFPADAYMFTNAFEFFAMTASVVLHGRAARPP